MTPTETDPFVDPSANNDTNLDVNDLLFDNNVSITCTKDALLVSDPALANRGRVYCCGLFRTKSQTCSIIPFYNILDASHDGNQITIVHALPTTKTAVRPGYITYSLAQKTSPEAVRAWIDRLLALAYRGSSRARRLKILINPHSGQGYASKVYAREAEPILKAAGCEVDIESTTHRGHAREIAKDIDVDRYDAIVCCSGDGTPHEVFNGLAEHAQPRKALRKLAVTQLPGGSGNALSINLNGTISPSLAALAIVKAARMPVDLVAISQGQQRYLSFLSQSVGIVAESDLGTDNIRWMGSARFTYGFLVRLLGKTLYPAEVSFKLESDDKDSIREANRTARKSSPDPETDNVRKTQDDEQDIPAAVYGTVNDPIPSDWITTDMPDLGNFYCGNMVHMAPDTPFFSAALPNDKLMDLVDIRGDIKRTVSVKLMLSVENNQVYNHKEVRYRKVRAYRISPRLRPGQTEGYISIDGERVEFAPFQAEVMPGLGTVLSAPGQVYHWNGPPDAPQ